MAILRRAPRSVNALRSDISRAVSLNSDQIADMLENLPLPIWQKVVPRASMAAMTPVLRDAKAEIRSKDLVRTGSLLQSLTKKRKVYRRAGTSVVMIGARRGSKKIVGFRRRGKDKGRALRQAARAGLSLPCSFAQEKPQPRGQAVGAQHRARPAP